MGSALPVPSRPAVAAGKTRICVAGNSLSHNVGRAQKLAAAIGLAHPDQYETWFYFSGKGYGNLLAQIKQELPQSQLSQPSTKDKGTTVADHHSVPFVWFESGGGADNKKEIEVKGGRDMFCEWAGQQFPNDPAIQALSSVDAPPLMDLFTFDTTTPGGTYLAAVASK